MVGDSLNKECEEVIDKKYELIFILFVSFPGDWVDDELDARRSDLSIPGESQLLWNAAWFNQSAKKGESHKKDKTMTKLRFVKGSIMSSAQPLFIIMSSIF